VNQVETAQRKISSELSLDQDSSALARMKKELETLIEKHNKINEEFREHVRTSLATLQARKEESQKSTRHGIEFEQALLEFVQQDSAAAGDIVEHTGGSPGLIKNCKVGDIVLNIGPERQAAGARIVMEAKERDRYDVKAALGEIETGRKNRDAKVGVFVFSKRMAPEKLSSLTRYGDDIIVVWDVEDTTTDVYLRAGLSLARALSVRVNADEVALEVDFERMQKAMLDLVKQSQGLEDIQKGAQSIRRTAEGIEDRARIIAENLQRSSRNLTEEVEAVKGALAAHEAH
jgi:hypothetical protein